MMNISTDPGKGIDCRENAERMIECVFLPNGGHGRTYEVEETRFAKRLRCPSVFRVVVRGRDGGFVGYARVAEHCVAPERQCPEGCCEPSEGR